MASSVAHRELSVSLGRRSYPIHIGHGLLAQAGELIVQALNCRRAVIVTDENVAARWLEPLQRALTSAGIRHEALTIPPGEASKSFSQLEGLLEQLLDRKPDRQTALVALGGGVVGDLTGFAASILLRGVPFVQIPTTLLAQVDSAVGGKTGINAAHGKNLIGSFYQPSCVISAAAVLDTLPDRQLRAGYAEIVKYGCINQPDFFEWLELNGTAVLARDPDALAHAVYTGCANKALVVNADEREAGQRALLNFGHTFGHALEKEAGYGDALLHGEAVAIGMVMATDYSVRLGLCAEDDLLRTRTHLQAASLPVAAHHLGLSDRVEDLLSHMRQDKKVRDSAMTFILTRGIGRAFVTREVHENSLRELLADYV